MPTHRITQAIRIRSNQTPDKEHSSPLFLTSSFCYDDAEDMRAVFADEKEAYMYSRFSNPTVQELGIHRPPDRTRRRRRRLRHRIRHERCRGQLPHLP